ncbi:uncharacterized protein PV09_02373 [Verruconis gallopava]|uniref:LIM zinc-binding domain-containing protein n=1 Tax=Verruconis gallopava TaxID=253628 RepID=A0A0D1Z120_9PEZI|nr:uncharacterized protein PV09_02373 [Verruconis gallopava]KIW06667.1 hypothetical protein PV09_02373 [Verruconis gallopava]
MLRSKSKDRIGGSSGMYMSNRQMGEYLNDLRNNRPSRPTGARPPPSSFVSKRYSTSNLSQVPSAIDQFKKNEDISVDAPPRCSSAQSFYKPAFSATGSETRHASNASISKPMAGRPVAREPKSESAQGDVEGPMDELPYLERGQRWLERQEAHSLRRALEDMDLKEEKKIFDAARDEAAELVWKHQNPNVPFRNPDIQPSSYREHLRKGSTHARTASWAQAAQDIQAKQMKRRSRESSASRSISGGSKESSAPNSRAPSDGSLKVPESPLKPPEEETVNNERQPRKRSVQFVEPTSTSGDEPAPQQPKTGLRKLIRSRTPSPSKAIQPQMKGEEKKEETQEQGQSRVSSISVAARMASNAMPAHFRNPFSRARESKGKLSRINTEPMPATKPFDRFEIQRNPPSQSRNPIYTTNNVETCMQPASSEDGVKMKDGKEIRSDDIRKATSASLKDRSQKLPMPTVVSDCPERPIVSFQKGWKPKEVELKEEVSSATTKPNTHTRPDTEQPPPASVAAESYSKTASEKPLRIVEKKGSAPSTSGSMQVPGRERERTSPPPAPLVPPPQEPSFPGNNHNGAPSVPAISVSSAPPVPVIAVTNDAASVPTIAINNSNPLSTPKAPRSSPLPSIAVGESRPERPAVVNNSRAAPTIAINDAPSIAVTAPSISVSGPPISGSSTRPLPVPGGRPSPRHAASAPAGSAIRNSHITPTGRFHPRSTGALCANCALPIAGRIVSAAGVRFHPECFRCHHCNEGLECVAFYPEPESHRLDRINRIRDRMAGYDVGGSPEEDGDESLRFYCHLDYHEFFSPRCKSCKTPIEGEVVVACGAEWHVGHFFCAQCGDPFDDKTPFVERDGYAWCVNCHTNRYSTKCKKCRKPVTDMVVKALDAEWHEECFRCTECNGRFDDGRYFIRPGGTDPYCPACEEMRLKA